MMIKEQRVNFVERKEHLHKYFMSQKETIDKASLLIF